MKTIDYKEFGKNGFVTPQWACLVNPDQNLKNYNETVLNTPFNKKRFRRPGVFRNIGEIFTKKDFSDFKGIRCLDMPIKMAGSMEYKLPKELFQFIEPVSKMISFEHAHNNQILDFYAYLTVDQSETEPGKEFHREPGLHVDGFQGARINPKVRCDRSYIVADCDNPSFWNQGFELAEKMDDSKVNIFHVFDRTKHYSSEIKTNPFEIYFMDCYSVHSANKNKSKRRTFVRLSFSVREFDRLGNSHNFCFDYNWPMFERNIAPNLV